MSVILHYPELETKEIEITIIATYSTLTGKYKVRSKNPLKEGRGIIADGTVDERGANNMPNKYAGYYAYYFTPNAFDKLQKTNEVVLQLYLD